MVDRLGPSADRAAAGGQQHANGFAIAASARLSEMRAGEGLLGGADRVEFVGLRAVASRGFLGPLDFEDPLAVREQEAAQAGAIAAAGLDRPGALAAGVAVREAQQALVAERVSREAVLDFDGSGSGEDCCGVRIAVRVDADDVVDLICEHRSRPPSTRLMDR